MCCREQQAQLAHLAVAGMPPPASPPCARAAQRQRERELAAQQHAQLLLAEEQQARQQLEAQQRQQLLDTLLAQHSNPATGSLGNLLPDCAAAYAPHCVAASAPIEISCISGEPADIWSYL